MNLFQLPEPSSVAFAFAERSSHQLIPGIGYVRHFKPPAPMPEQPKFQAPECEPPGETADGTLHTLLGPNGEEVPQMRWHPEQREWAPLVPFRANRLAFTSQYLAAHGWKYGHSQ